MFFKYKKLIANKEKLNTKIQTEYDRMDVAYQSLKNALSEFYCGHQHFDHFDITVVDFWFGDIACAYSGNNYDLSNAFFRMSEQLDGVEAEDVSNNQLVGIYNIFTILLNDMYACEEPILLETDLTLDLLLIKFKGLSEMFISHLKKDESPAAEGMCEAVEKLYTLLDFSLNNTAMHKHLRSLKKEYLETQAECDRSAESPDRL